MLYTVLAVSGAIVAVAMTGAGAFAAWTGIAARRSRRPILIRRMLMDYGALAVFALGAMMMLADLAALVRDKESYPYYHYGYLFVAFIFMLGGMLFTTIRLWSLTGSSSSRSPFDGEHRKPDKTDETEQWV